jgi:predicted permease
MMRVKKLKTTQGRGVGLFSHRQERHTTPFQYFAQIVVGMIVISLGAMLGYDQYQSPMRRSTGGILVSAAFIVVGIFWGHAGAIFWYRRLLKR